jgi:asparagine synthase (glutamine-hydrolysing)
MIASSPQVGQLLDVPVDLTLSALETMSPLEIATGFVTGRDALAVPETSGGAARSGVRETLAQLLLPALTRSPCIIEFSGGRDSSLLLAVAIATARREGLAEPIAVTKRHPGLTETLEAEWQELVVRYLGVTDWVRLDFDSELDAVGPVAQRLLPLCGVVWPPMLWSMWPFLRLARGGSLVSGEGGDEMFGTRRPAPVAHLIYERHLKLSTLKHSAIALAPRPARVVLLRRLYREQPPLPWLRPDASAMANELFLQQQLAEPLRWRASLFWQRSLRSEAMFVRNASRLAAALEVERVVPFLDTSFLAALAKAGPFLGYSSRTAALRANFVGLLPDDVLSRRSKAFFNRAWFAQHTRDFASRWSGNGLDEQLVDPEALRAEWLRESPNALSVAALQAAWLAEAKTQEALKPAQTA